MENNLIKAQALLKKYGEGNCTPEEAAWIENWYLNLNSGEKPLADNLLRDDLAELESQLSGITKKRQHPAYATIAAAAVIVLVSGVALFQYSENNNTEIHAHTLATEDIKAGGNKAILTLADGSQINLTDAKAGTLLSAQGIKISKEADGQVVYNVSGNTSSSEPLTFNTIETPRGGQYKVILPDGTYAWLNAASSLRYPASFGQLKERRVELSGEAYFEVAHNKQQPFIVTAAGQDVKVLGTHFNVNAYSDEPVKRTTLLEGSVAVSKGGKTSLLKPGEQSELSAAGFTVSAANTETATAWKNGMTAFRKTDVKQVLREISRWYDIEIEYSGPLPDYTISGKVSRQSNLSAILKILALSDVRYKQQGRKIIIQN